MSQVVRFSNFATDMQNCNPNAKLSSRLALSYQGFRKAITPPKTPFSDEELVKAFSQKYGINLPDENGFQSKFLKYTNVFRKLFPDLKVESQPYGFHMKNLKGNLFELQWDLLSEFIKKHPESLNEKLCAVFSENSDYDTALFHIRVLTDAGGKITADGITSEMAHQALLKEDPRFFQLLLSYGYLPAEDDLIFVIKEDPSVNRFFKAKVLIQLGVKLPSDALQYLQKTQDLKSYQFLL